MDEDFKKQLELYKKFRKSPLFFIKKIWGLKPQPLKPSYRYKDWDLDKYGEEHFEEFTYGENLTWQQWIFFEAVERAIRKKNKKRISVFSGHGTGKSADLSLLLLWYLFCFKDAQIGTTAPSSDQLFDVLWKEIAKWLRLMPKKLRSKYEWQSEYVRVKERPETWFARARTAKKENPEVIAGLHGEHIMILVDEASGVPDKIFETAEGSLTGQDIFYILAGNPLRREGYFYESHNRDRNAWQCLRFNSENSPIVEDDYTERMKEKYGEDSLEYRTRVLGLPPKEGAIDERGYTPLLREKELELAQQKASHFGEERLGVDPADAGGDKSTLVKRSSGYAEILFAKANVDMMTMVGHTVLATENIDSDKIYIDSVGVGAGFYRRIAEVNRQRAKGKKFFLIRVNQGDSATDDRKFKNKKAEMFWRLRSWIKGGGRLKPDPRWRQLLKIKYKPDSKGRIKIISKRELRRDGIPSPDIADALSLTFADKEVDLKPRISPETKFFYKKMRENERKKGKSYSRKMTP